MTRRLEPILKVLALSLLSIAAIIHGQALPGVNPFDPSKMIFPTKVAFIAEGTAEQRQAVWATLQGVRQTLTPGSIVTGSVNRIFFKVRTMSTKQPGEILVVPIEIDMNVPLSQMPAANERIWILGTMSSLKDDGTIVLTDGQTTTPHGQQVSPQLRALWLSRMPQPAAPPTSRQWTTNSDIKVGDCHILPGARIDLSISGNGINLHFQGQMKTDASIMGDIFHTTFAFYDKSDPNRVVLISPEVDLPQNSAMHPQFGNYSVDYQITISPLPQPTDLLNSLGDAEIRGSC